MAAPKFKEFFEMMVKQNQAEFDQFLEIHNNFVANPAKWKAEFDEKGRDIQDIIRVYENRLCAQSEGSGRSRFTLGLSEKFQAEVKKMLPKIDLVGAE